jgi:hypothetical protein
LEARTYTWRETLGPTIALFGSLGTLVCCALPALLVTLGLGAAMAGLVSAVPQLVWLSEHKAWVFGISGAVIAASAVMHIRSRDLACPADAARARACARLRWISSIVLSVAIAAWAVGFFFAFLAAPLFYGP